MLSKLKLFVFLQLLILSITCQSGAIGKYTFNNPLYIGFLGGYGSTTWQGLVPNTSNQNQAMSMSTPIRVEEGGGVWGALIGYEFTPFFALEATYMRFSDAKVTFDEMSLFSFKNNGQLDFTTRTETLSAMGKIMLVLPNPRARIYSSAGVAELHRKDMILNQWQLSPTFGVGINYHFTNHLMADLGGNYTAGYGESQLDPALTYVPFLYSFALRLSYCF